MRVVEGLQICRFCDQPAQLRNSHVVSESFYKGLYEEGRFFEIIADEAERDLIRQKGMREKLLCGDCESFLANEYEDYGARTFRKIKFLSKEKRKQIQVANLDYKRFKLFLLTQLWRMSVTGLPHWQHVRLPKEIEEDIRLMIRNGDPRKFDTFGVMMEAIFATDGEHFEAFMPPKPILIGQCQFVLASFSGFSWYFSLGRSVGEPKISSFFLTENGSLKVGARDLSDAWHIQDYVKELESVGKFPMPKIGNRTRR